MDFEAGKAVLCPPGKPALVWDSSAHLLLEQYITGAVQPIPCTLPRCLAQCVEIRNSYVVAFFEGAFRSQNASCLGSCPDCCCCWSATAVSRFKVCTEFLQCSMFKLGSARSCHRQIVRVKVLLLLLRLLSLSACMCAQSALSPLTGSHSNGH